MAQRLLQVRLCDVVNEWVHVLPSTESLKDFDSSLRSHGSQTAHLIHQTMDVDDLCIQGVLGTEVCKCELDL